MGFKTITYGDFSEAPRRSERQIVHFKTHALNTDQLWENGSLSAFYISNFWETYFHSRQYSTRADIRDSVRYIAAELIGNAVKYGTSPDILINVTLNLNIPEFRIVAVNTVETNIADVYMQFIERLLASDPEKFYIDQMEKNATDPNWQSSIGFLTIMLDYGGQLAWKFKSKDDATTLTATTMVRVPVSGIYSPIHGEPVNGSCWQEI